MAFVAAFLYFVLQIDGAAGSPFLSRELTSDMEITILAEIEGVISDGKGMDKIRLSQLEDMLRTTFLSMPKNKHGNLGHAAVRYVLHSFFVQRHAWSLRGLGNGRDDEAITLQDKMQEFVQEAFERRLGIQGLNLHELSVLAATYENLIHAESMDRLNHTMSLLLHDQHHDFSVSAVDEILDVYMMGFLLNVQFTSAHHLEVIEKDMTITYPDWKETQMFLRDVRQRRSMGIHYFSRIDVESMVGALNDEYGRWQNRHCIDLKQKLLAMEDKSIGYNGSGRVRLAEFYQSALREANWQFVENREYLAQIGALDTHDPNVPRVIITNYLASPANCLASSKFYAVCCISECEDLMEHIEHRFAAPAVSPDELTQFVSQLSSSSVVAGRTLQPVLLDRMTDIASVHGGVVPIHGRLFAQWMHHAFPRECPYPHLSGTTKFQTPHDFAQDNNFVPVASEQEMLDLVLSTRAEDASAGTLLDEECTSWSHHEELYALEQHAIRLPRSVWASFRPVAHLCVLVAGFWVVLRSMPHRKCVALLFGHHVGKDAFV